MTIDQAVQRLGSTLLFAGLKRDLLKKVEKFDNDKLDTSEDHLFDLLAQAVAIIGRMKP